MQGGKGKEITGGRGEKRTMAPPANLKELREGSGWGSFGMEGLGLDGCALQYGDTAGFDLHSDMQPNSKSWQTKVVHC